jgi:hypothetical protein
MLDDIIKVHLPSIQKSIISSLNSMLRSAPLGSKASRNLVFHNPTRVPALDRFPRRTGDEGCWQTTVLICSSASSGTAIDNIVQGVPACAIDPRIEKSKR